MKEIKVKLPDGVEKSVPAGITVQEMITAWKPEVLSSTIAARVNQTPVDLSHALQADGTISLIDVQSREGLGILRHSISHVMAQAVQDTFRNVQVSIGPSIEEGFYYDFEYAETFTPEDLEKIEKRMREIAEAIHSFKRREVSRDEAVSLFKSKGESYKVELLSDLPVDVIVNMGTQERDSRLEMNWRRTGGA
ncbi:MAG: TGS domain-containing protein [Deltaproteobacteria bacterium]|nr:TGS domain-containing protein [Deltaproteobacteria bacterium]